MSTEWKLYDLTASGKNGYRFSSGGIAQQAEESVDRTLALDELRRRYENEYGGIQYAKHRLACNLSNSPT